MSVVDIVIAVFCLAMAAIGFERGLVGSAVPLAGFIAGVAAGARLAPSLLADGAESPYAPAVAAAGGILLGLFLAVALEGVGAGLGARLRERPSTRALDAAGGAVLLAALGLAAAWVFGAVALNISGAQTRDLRESVQRSSILAALNEVLPPSGPLLNALRRIDPTRSVRGPDANVPAPDPALVEDPEVRRAARSVVLVRGTACGLGIEGSGWVAGRDLVVSNAHVVAGQDDTTVTTPDGAELDAQVVHYDPRNDLSVMRVPGLAVPALSIDPTPSTGTAGASIGYPGGGPLTSTPARLGRTGTVTSQDSYGRGPVQRRMTPFRGEVQGGNSGGPVVDGEGRVLTTVFASSLDERRTGGLGVPNQITRDALAGRLDAVDSGPCAA